MGSTGGVLGGGGCLPAPLPTLWCFPTVEGEEHWLRDSSGPVSPRPCPPPPVSQFQPWAWLEANGAGGGRGVGMSGALLREEVGRGVPTGAVGPRIAASLPCFGFWRGLLNPCTPNPGHEGPPPHTWVTPPTTSVTLSQTSSPPQKKKIWVPCQKGSINPLPPPYQTTVPPWTWGPPCWVGAPHIPTSPHRGHLGALGGSSPKFLC